MPPLPDFVLFRDLTAELFLIETILTGAASRLCVATKVKKITI
jgi:hypothetical protein